MKPPTHSQRFSLAPYLVLLLLCVFSAAAGTSVSVQQPVNGDDEQAHSRVPLTASFAQQITPVAVDKKTPSTGKSKTPPDTAVAPAPVWPLPPVVAHTAISLPAAPAALPSCTLPPLRAPPRV